MRCDTQQPGQALELLGGGERLSRVKKPGWAVGPCVAVVIVGAERDAVLVCLRRCDIYELGAEIKLVLVRRKSGGVIRLECCRGVQAARHLACGMSPCRVPTCTAAKVDCCVLMTVPAPQWGVPRQLARARVAVKSRAMHVSHGAIPSPPPSTALGYLQTVPEAP